MTEESIIETTCRIFGVKPEWLSWGNHRPVSDANKVIRRLLFKNGIKTTTQAGELTNCDHSTVSSSSKAVVSLYGCDKVFRARYDLVCSELGFKDEFQKQ